MFFQETLGDKVSIVSMFEPLFPSWKFVGIDTKDRSSGLVIGWNPKYFRALNSWALESFP
jgi:hypothetical protein